MRVLLATDGSKHAEEAAWLLAHLSHNDPLELTVLAVTPMIEIHSSYAVFVEWNKRNAPAEIAQATEACRRIERVFEGANARVEIIVAEGHSGKTIVSEAEARDIDLVVIGALGRSTFDRIVLGSVSDFVATHAPCSVLVVRPTGLRERQNGELNVCVAYDDSEPSRFALKGLRQFNWRTNTRMDIVNMISLPFNYSDMPVEIDIAEIMAARMKVVERISEEVRELTPNVSPYVLEANHVGDGLVKFTKQHSSDLIVLGDTGHGLLGRFFMGSVSRFVLRHTHCSVWIARSNKCTILV